MHLLLLLYFFSGFTGLVFEVVWMNRAALFFGNSVHSAATVTAAFFLGLGAGSFVLGKRVSRGGNGLVLYGVFELLVSATALLSYGVSSFYPQLAGIVQGSPADSVGFTFIVKFFLVLLMAGVPAFFMGGSFPALGQYLVRSKPSLGTTASLLYAVNTCGAVCGALSAGFFLPLYLGYRGTYLLAVLFCSGIGVVAIVRGRALPVAAAREPAPDASAGRPSNQTEHPGLPIILLVSCISGFCTIGIEVLWTRMFAQVLQNSVYAFSAILAVYLLALAVGSFAASQLCRLKMRTGSLLMILLLVAAVAAALSTPLYLMVTGLQSQGMNLPWARYVARVIFVIASVIFIPGVIMGTILPLLLRAGGSVSVSPGYAIGTIVSINTLGAIAGSLTAGFVIIPTRGVYSGINTVALLYCAMALTIAIFTPRLKLRYKAIPLISGLVVMSFPGSNMLPRVSIDQRSKARVLEIYEGSSATVAVVEENGGVGLRVNNTYTLGGTHFAKEERLLGELPLALHPGPKNVFVIGMGTGITAGAALQPGVERLVVAELIPEVIMAARTYFGPLLNGLFSDPRATVIAGDGRNALQYAKNTFDVIIGDLFYPEEAQSLFTSGHFGIVKSRLSPEGIFAQWLPLYQMTEREFGIIAATMLDAFPVVTLWRGDFFARHPAVALVGHMQGLPGQSHTSESLNRLTVIDTIAGVPDSASRFIYYVGNLTRARSLFKTYPVNTDDHPLIRYLAPLSPRSKKSAAGDTYFTGVALVKFYDALSKAAPFADDPYLARSQPGASFAAQTAKAHFGNLAVHGARAAAYPAHSQ